MKRKLLLLLLGTIALTLLLVGAALDGPHIVAEGVENAQQAAYLRQEGCEILQGFYFSRPVDARAFSRLLKDGFANPSA